MHSRSRTTALWPSFHRPCCLCNLPVSGGTNAHRELWGPVQSLLPSSGVGPAAPHPPPPMASSQDARAHFSPLHTNRQQMRPSMPRKVIWTSSKESSERLEEILPCPQRRSGSKGQLLSPTAAIPGLSFSKEWKGERSEGKSFPNGGHWWLEESPSPACR